MSLVSGGERAEVGHDVVVEFVDHHTIAVDVELGFEVCVALIPISEPAHEAAGREGQ